ncbi:MAG: autotransporter-associated beta strand repeat-containing protein, partial [Planctomycetaceae bacterium]
EGGNYNWQMLSGTGVAGSATAWDVVSVSGSLAIAATSTNQFRINLWTLSGVAPDVSGSAANFNSATNYAWTIATAAGGISGFAADKFTVVTSATNGTGGFANAFGTGTFSVAQNGNNLQLVFTAGAAPSVITINVPSGTQTQTQAGYPTLSGSVPVLKTGAGTLVLDQANTLSGSTTVQGGVLRLANGSALSASRLVVVAGGTGQVAPVTTTSVASLDLATGNGLVDLTSGALTIAGGMTATELVAEILEGRGDGSWTGTSGITSSVAAAEVASSIPRAVGWVDNGDGSLTAAYAAPGTPTSTGRSTSSTRPTSWHSASSTPACRPRGSRATSATTGSWTSSTRRTSSPPASTTWGTTTPPPAWAAWRRCRSRP